MTRPCRRGVVVFVALVPLMLSVSTRADKGEDRVRIARHYKVHPVGPSDGIVRSSAVDVDNAGRVLGTWVDAGGATHGFLPCQDRIRWS